MEDVYLSCESLSFLEILQKRISPCFNSISTIDDVKRKMILDLIQKPAGTLDILVYLSKKGASDVTTILRDLGMYTKTFYSAAERLKSLGLVFERKETGWPTRVFYELTYKGEEAVKYLLPLEGIVVDSMNAQWRALEKLESKRKTLTNKKRMLDLLRNLQESSFDLGDWDETLQLSERSVELAGSIGDDRSLSHAHRYAGLVHQKRCDASKAEECLEKSMRISSGNEEWDNVADDHYILGALYERTGDLEKASSHYERSMDCARKADWKVAMARARLGFGRLLGRRGEYEESLKEIQQAVKEFEKADAEDELARAYGNLGSSMFYFDKEKALVSYEKSIEIARKTGDVRMLGFGLSNACSCYIGKGELKKASEYLGEAEGILVKLDDKPAIASVCIHRGCIRKLEGKWRDAEESFQMGIDISEKAGAQYHLGDALLHYGLLLSERNRIGQSKTVLKRAKAIFEELGNDSKAAKVMTALEALSQ